jgi:hypothetical protein
MNDRPSLLEIIEEVVTLSVGVVIVLLPALILAIPGLIVFVVLPALLVAIPLAAIAVVLAPPCGLAMLTWRLVRRR